MLYKIFSVYDVKADAYLTPFFQPTAGQATRMFLDAVSDESHQFHKHAGDYTLFEIGKYDDISGIVEPLNAKINLGCAIEYIAKSHKVVKEVAK